MRPLLVFVLLWTAAAPSAVFAENEKLEISADMLNTLLRRIEMLETRVAELEKEKLQSRAVGQEAASAAPIDAVAAQAPAQMPETRPAYPDLKFAGFTDYNFSATNEPESRSGFDEGQFVLHVRSPLSSKISVFGELALTAGPRGFTPSVERTIIQLAHRDYLRLSFGRHHTPVNWWNTAFHHGLWLQTSIARPEMTRFGGQFIPVHFLGGLVEGSVPASGLNLNYSLGLGNGRSGDVSGAGDAGDVNNDRAWLGNFFFKPDRFYGMQAGGSFYRDRISLPGGRDFREWISSAHFVWSRETPEVIGEFANVRHRELGGSESYDSQAFYIQVAHRLPWNDNAFKPYYRYEYIEVDESDPVFFNLPGLRGSTVGLRYDFSLFAAFKAEYRRWRRPNQDSVDGGFMQISFTF